MADFAAQDLPAAKVQNKNDQLQLQPEPTPPPGTSSVGGYYYSLLGWVILLAAGFGIHF